MLRVIFRSIPGGLPGLAVTDGIDTTVIIDPDVRIGWALDDLSDLTLECVTRLLEAVLPGPAMGTVLQLVG